MSDAAVGVLFVCTGNSARSIIAECVLNRLGQGRFNAYSAGSHPKGEVHPYALDILKEQNHDISKLSSKSWDEFAETHAPKIDVVITVCDNAAGEACPVWPGNPMTVHWGLPDPAAAKGSEDETRQAFADCLEATTRRIDALCDLPVADLDKQTLRARLEAIGRPQERAESAWG